MKRITIKCDDCEKIIGYMPAPPIQDTSDHISSVCVGDLVGPILCPWCEVAYLSAQREMEEDFNGDYM